MSKQISLKLTDKNDWLVDKLNEEKQKQNRPSFNNKNKIDHHLIIW